MPRKRVGMQENSLIQKQNTFEFLVAIPFKKWYKSPYKKEEASILKAHMTCPCKSQKNYDECCKPYHTGELLPADALLLMRSRYSAYALGLADYIIQTTHPEHPEINKKNWEWREDILSFSRDTEFIDLEVLLFEDGEQKAFVTFTASLKQLDKDFSYTEKSLFEKKDEQWLYKEAEFL